MYLLYAGSGVTSDVLQEIHSRISARGRITFAEFMELALYWPQGGYYSSHRSGGIPGDFYTAPAAHPVFGALIAVQLEQMWRILGRPSPFVVVEIGAGNGLLCRDVLRYAAGQFPSLRSILSYILLERRPSPQLWAEGPAREQAHLVVSETTPLRGVVGCFVSNELIDSFPVHRVAMEGDRLREIYVGLEDGKLVEVLGEPSTPRLGQRFEGLNISLTSGFRTEVCLALDPWMEGVASAIDRGYVITVDYGHPAPALYSQGRSRGTLRCYYQHTLGSNPYTLVGSRDITAHVDFSTLMAVGERCGLVNAGFVSQRELLSNLGLDYFVGALEAKGLMPGVLNANRMGILELARPGGMGDFRVLIQGKGVPPEPLYSLTPDNAWKRGVAQRLMDMDVPLLTADHMPLMAGRYPHAAWEWRGHWPSEEGAR